VLTKKVTALICVETRVIMERHASLGWPDVFNCDLLYSWCLNLMHDTLMQNRTVGPGFVLYNEAQHIYAFHCDERRPNYYENRTGTCFYISWHHLSLLTLEYHYMRFHLPGINKQWQHADVEILQVTEVTLGFGAADDMCLVIVLCVYSSVVGLCWGVKLYTIPFETSGVKLTYIAASMYEWNSFY
jgi:hypothetical protein